MNNIVELEYRGLNLLDEISTVEIAINLENHVIHIFDQNQVVEPEYNFSSKKYQLSEGFYKMTKVLYDKQFLGVNKSLTIDQSINQMTWIFYGSKKSILKYEAAEILEVFKLDVLDEETIRVQKLFEKYIARII